MSGDEKKTVYSYSALSADGRREAERIRELYRDACGGKGREPRKEPPAGGNPTLGDLLALEHRVRRGSDITAALFGTVCALVFGSGLSVALGFGMTLAGSLWAFPGIIGMACTPALHTALMRRGRRKNAAEAERICACLLHG